MRADRLLTLMMLLKTRGRMTAQRLALELEVSERTIYRDLFALRVAGLPVYTERGRGGGCYLHEDFRLGLPSLTGEELAALFVTGVPAPLRELGLDSPLRAAMLKVADALPEARRDHGQRAGRKVHVDATPWASRQKPVPHLQVLHKALVDKRWVDVVFRRVQGILSRRQVAPLGLVAKVASWYMIWAGEDGCVRVDPVSRVVEACLTERHIEHLEDLDVAAFWERWCRRQEASRSSLITKLLVAPRAVAYLEERYGATRDVDAGVGDCNLRDWVPVRVTFTDLYEARKELLGLGGAIRVVTPKALRLTVADFAAAAAALYHGHGGSDPDGA